MSRKRHIQEQIIRKLRDAEVFLGKGPSSHRRQGRSGPRSSGNIHSRSYGSFATRVFLSAFFPSLTSFYFRRNACLAFLAAGAYSLPGRGGAPAITSEPEHA